MCYILNEIYKSNSVKSTFGPGIVFAYKYNGLQGHLLKEITVFLIGQQ
jgi:hypothetical protein